MLIRLHTVSSLLTDTIANNTLQVFFFLALLEDALYLPNQRNDPRQDYQTKEDKENNITQALVRLIPTTPKCIHSDYIQQRKRQAKYGGQLENDRDDDNVDTNARILCYDIRDLGKQLLPVGMLVVLDSIFNRIIRNRGLKRNTWIYIDEIYLLFQHEYSANFLFTLWKRMRKYQACGTGISQNIEDLLQSHTARTMLANSEFLIMLNQAATDREELARLLNISDNQLSYITNVDSGRGLIKCGSAIVPFVDSFPRHTRLYQMMTTRPSDLIA